MAPFIKPPISDALSELFLNTWHGHSTKKKNLSASRVSNSENKPGNPPNKLYCQITVRRSMGTMLPGMDVLR